jgi:hypothetical protein
MDPNSREKDCRMGVPAVSNAATVMDTLPGLKPGMVMEFSLAVVPSTSLPKRLLVDSSLEKTV